MLKVIQNFKGNWTPKQLFFALKVKLNYKKYLWGVWGNKISKYVYPKHL